MVVKDCARVDCPKCQSEDIQIIDDVPWMTVLPDGRIVQDGGTYTIICSECGHRWYEDYESNSDSVEV